MSTTFIVEAKPLPQPRGKVVMLGKRPSVVVPDKHPIHLYRRCVVDAWRIDRFRFDDDAAIACQIDIVASRPATLVWKTKPMPRLLDTRHVGDVDNYAKAILDSLNGNAYADDAQVAQLLVRRWIASGKEEPHAVVTLFELDDLATREGVASQLSLFNSPLFSEFDTDRT